MLAHVILSKSIAFILKCQKLIKEIVKLCNFIDSLTKTMQYNSKRLVPDPDTIRNSMQLNWNKFITATRFKTKF